MNNIKIQKHCIVLKQNKGSLDKHMVYLYDYIKMDLKYLQVTKGYTLKYNLYREIFLEICHFDNIIFKQICFDEYYFYYF